MIYGYYFDDTYILIVIGMVICLVAQAHVNSTFKKYSRVQSNSGLTGAQAAKRILESQGIYDVTIQHIAGELTDNYNPRNKVLSLSSSTYNSTSVAAIGVAAHECGCNSARQRICTYSSKKCISSFCKLGLKTVMDFDYSWNYLLRTGNRSDNDRYWYFCIFIGSIIPVGDITC